MQQAGPNLLLRDERWGLFPRGGHILLSVGWGGDPVMGLVHNHLLDWHTVLTPR
jgi:hypothetical protein